MIDQPDVLAVILGRAGSKGVPCKNWCHLAGRPVIAYTIDHARQAQSVSDLVVSTDGPEIAAVAEDAGVRVIDRPAELATDTATVAAAARHAVEHAGGAHPVIVILYANVPVRPVGLVDRAVEALRETGADSVQSYAPVERRHPFWMVALDDAGRVAPFVENRVDRRQDLPALFMPDGGVIAVTRASLLGSADDHPHAFLGADRRGVITDPGDVIDVDEPADLARAEAYLGASTTAQGVVW